MPANIESIFCCPLCKGALTAFSAADAISSVPVVGGPLTAITGALTAVGNTHAADHVESPAIRHGFKCGACDREYPVIAGIIDFRICADPYIDIEADRAKALRIAGKADGLSFEELVAFYYSVTPEVPDDLARHYLNHHVAGVKRGEGILSRMRSYQLNVQAESGVKLLDLGCGTGGLLAAASVRGASCVGADIALRWLVIARSRFRDLGCDEIPLICACADHLPFVADSFDVILAENLIEHCSDTTKVFSEIKRIRRSGGAFMARTINRFAMGPEPHVGVWGVGYLPRSLMNSYVKLVKRIPYEHIHLESFGSLNQALQAVGDRNLETKVPLITRSDYAHHPKWKQKLFEMYSAVMRIPVVGAIMAQLGPYIDVGSKSVKDTASHSIPDKNAIYK